MFWLFYQKQLRLSQKDGGSHVQLRAALPIAVVEGFSCYSGSAYE